MLYLEGSEGEDGRGSPAERERMRLLTRKDTKAHRIGKRKSIKALLRRSKDKPCADCGNRYAVEVMDFDHIPERGPKLFNLSKCGGDWTFADVEREIFKCEVVCANCHRLRTSQRKKEPLKLPGFAPLAGPRLAR